MFEVCVWVYVFGSWTHIKRKKRKDVFLKITFSNLSFFSPLWIHEQHVLTDRWWWPSKRNTNAACPSSTRVGSCPADNVFNHHLKPPQWPDKSKDKRHLSIFLPPRQPEIGCLYLSRPRLTMWGQFVLLITLCFAVLFHSRSHFFL